MDFNRRVCKGLCQVIDPDMGMCCGLCSTDDAYVQKVYQNMKREHAQGRRKQFTVIPALEISVPTPAPLRA